MSTTVTFYGDATKVMNIISDVAEDEGIEVKFQGFSVGRLNCFFPVTLTANQSTVLQKILDAFGYGKIT